MLGAGYATIAFKRWCALQGRMDCPSRPVVV